MIYVTRGAFSNMIVNRFNAIYDDTTMELPYYCITDDVVDLPTSTELVVLSGGADVSPKLYGEENKSSYCDEYRDKFEFEVIKDAVHKNIPIFGICRGIQILNVFFGGTLHQEIQDIQTSPHSGGHDLTYFKTSHFADGYSKVNSMHHQGIKQLADGFDLIASYGGIPEIIAHKKYSITAVQFHPECMSTSFIFKHLMGRVFRKPSIVGDRQ